MRAFVLLSLCASLALTGPTPAQQVPASDTEIKLSYAPVVRQSAPAVVNIYASWVTERHASPFANDPFFSQFFEGFGQTMPRVENSLGSGVIVDPAGIVVSNYHVVQEATDIRVVLADRREFDGEVLLSDREADIAVIRLDQAEDLPALAFADSEAAEVGDLVLAIGNPFGVGQTVSSGIVSATARTGAATRQRSGYFIQTDAPINPGNSGGALVDMSGQLLGLNTSILTRSGGSNGIGFAIPANLVAQYVEQAKAGRDSFARVWSGISVQQVDAGLAQALGQAVPAGVLVSEMHPESPFAAAGLQAGDVILSVDGLPVHAGDALEYRLLTLGAGAVATIELLRDGKSETVSVALSEAPGDEAEPVRIEGRSPLAGLIVADITPQLIDQLDLSVGASGLIVLRAGGASARLGLRTGDIVVRLNGQDITDSVQFKAMIDRGARAWDMQLARSGRLLRLRVRN
ncbi:trypsin-like peptidase domain-containing protein [Tropicimonas sp. TH_r6]|uniref:trypsin-like peptidase domain-containing protein n=1 Tax=Tropicimonas sp. TH_r6 TaxID=3082085 RepID=UPI002954B5E7|nr:trypsin-like peptidase domain-containing protein [Tropicimonas sp. TH_r6]MDV7144704.1 trypsin-like peptidase domain-containing protein [Tropicimonas sp. TH_r6]